MTVDTWEHCYGESWKGYILEAAFAHPAKASKALLFKIVAHAMAERWVRAADTVLDPFSGIGTTALPCLLQGINFVGCELEPRFVAWAQENLAYWHQRYGHRMQGARGVVVQGDSRDLGNVLASADLVCSSPPYANGCVHETGQDAVAVRGRAGTQFPWGTRAGGGDSLGAYSDNPANLGNLAPGSLDAAIASPPYAEGLSKEHTYQDHVKRDKDSHRRIMTEKGIVDPHYGTTAGNLGSLKAGDIGAILSSPPYADGCTHTGGADPHPEHIQGGPLRYVDYAADVVVGSPPFRDSDGRKGGSDLYMRVQSNPSRAPQNPSAAGYAQTQPYGQTDGQLGAMPGGGGIEGIVSSPPYAGAG